MTRSAALSQPAPAFVARIRKALLAAEASADASLEKQLDLMRSIVVARQTESAPAANAGQEALMRLSRALTKQLEVGNDLFRAHAALRHDAVDVLMVAGEEDCPPPSEGSLKAEPAMIAEDDAMALAA